MEPDKYQQYADEVRRHRNLATAGEKRLVEEYVLDQLNVLSNARQNVVQYAESQGVPLHPRINALLNFHQEQQPQPGPSNEQPGPSRQQPGPSRQQPSRNKRQGSAKQPTHASNRAKQAKKTAQRLRARETRVLKSVIDAVRAVFDERVAHVHPAQSASPRPVVQQPSAPPTPPAVAPASQQPAVPTIDAPPSPLLDTPASPQPEAPPLTAPDAQQPDAQMQIAAPVALQELDPDERNKKLRKFLQAKVGHFSDDYNYISQLAISKGDAYAYDIMEKF